MKTQRATTALARKLLYIRLWKGISQADILAIVHPDFDRSNRAVVSQWEKAMREPSRQILIRYARFANVTLEELLIDDNQLPHHIIEAAQAAGADQLFNKVRRRNQVVLAR